MSRVVADTEPRRCLRMLNRIAVYERKEWRCTLHFTHEGPHSYTKRNRGEAPLLAAACKPEPVLDLEPLRGTLKGDW